MRLIEDKWKVMFLIIVLLFLAFSFMVWPGLSQEITPTPTPGTPEEWSESPINNFNPRGECLR